jgi:hypothetical protein
MSDEQDFSYQTESEPIEPEVIESEPVETEPADSPPQEEPKGIKVKYNKEEQFVPETDIPSYVQKGLNYDKVQQQLEQTKQQAAYLDKLATMSGYPDTQEFLKAVEQAEQQRQVEEAANKMGIDPNTYQQYFQPVNQRLQSYEQELQQLRMQETTRQIENTVSQLEQKYPDFQKYANDAFNMAITRGYDLEHAYKLASYEDKLNNLSKQTEQQVLAQVTGRTGKQVLPSTDKPNNTKFDPSSMDLKDIEAISKRVQRGETIRF